MSPQLARKKKSFGVGGEVTWFISNVLKCRDRVSPGSYKDECPDC